MPQLFVVPHTHWDREWYQSFQDFRRRLVRLTDRLLTLLEGDPSFSHFHFDGQTIVLEDYLEIRPENRARLRRLITAGRISIGPWYVLPDEFLVSGESLIRNLQLGHRQAEEFGEALPIGYLPDQFGHVAQMPQILRQLGIEDAVVWRGVGANVDRTEFLWQAPDGSQVFTVFLPGWGYSNGRTLPPSVDALRERLQQIVAEHAPFRRSDLVLVMNGTDHQEPQPGLPALLAELRREGVDARLATLSEYVAEARSAVGAASVSRERAIEADLPVHCGELRSPLRSHLLPGVSSARISQKQRDFLNVGLLERYAEPLATWADRLSGERNLAGFTDWAWKLALQNHPHDSICGCSIDTVHKDMEYRFDQVESVARRTAEQALRAVAGRVLGNDHLAGSPCAEHDGMTASQPVLAVYNPNHGGRVLVTARSQEDDPETLVLTDAAGRTVPLQVDAGSRETVLDIELPPAAVRPHIAGMHGRELFGYFVNGLLLDRSGSRLSARVSVDHALRGPLDIATLRQQWLTQLDDPLLETVHVLARTPAAVDLTFVTDLRGFGITPLLRSTTEARPDLTVAMLEASDSALENDFYRIVVEVDGTLTIADKENGLSLVRCNQFVDEGDRGDEYNFDALPEDGSIRSPKEPPQVRLVRSGPVAASLAIRGVWSLPRALAADRVNRSAGRVDVPIETIVTLYRGFRRIDFVTEVDNGAEDHRLRVCFGTPLRSETIACEQAFAVVERPLALEPAGSFEQPIGTVPQKTFSLVEQNGLGVALFNRGIPEIEALAGESGTTLALTLIRAVGWLSRGDLRMRNGHAGPGLPTPGAQCPGRHRFEYALTTYAGGWDEARRVAQAHQYAYPPMLTTVDAAGTTAAVTTAAASCAPLHLDNPHVVVSAITPSRGAGFIARLYNPTRRDQIVDLAADGIGRVVAIDLRDRPRPARLSRLRRTHDGWRLTLRAGEIISLRLTPSRT